MARSGRYFKDPEFRFYFLFWLLSGLFITVNVWGPVYTGFGASLRAAFFQTTSIMTTTGFVTADFNIWPQPSRMLLVLLMFVGCCAGSTGGGIKVVRMMVMWKKMLKEVHPFMRPPCSTADRLPADTKRAAPIQAPPFLILADQMFSR